MRRISRIFDTTKITGNYKCALYIGYKVKDKYIFIQGDQLTLFTEPKELVLNSVTKDS